MTAQQLPDGSRVFVIPPERYGVVLSLAGETTGGAPVYRVSIEGFEADPVLVHQNAIINCGPARARPRAMFGGVGRA
ncbi:MAG: hypothetical protein AB7P52_17595 [Alphaproteobacteria bacterium]